MTYQKLAKSLGMKHIGRVFYGQVGQFLTSFHPNLVRMGNRAFSYYCVRVYVGGVQDCDPDAEPAMIIAKAIQSAMAGHMSFQSADEEGMLHGISLMDNRKVVAINLLTGRGSKHYGKEAMSALEHLMTQVIPSLTAPDCAASCATCGAPGVSEWVLLPDESVVPMDRACAEQLISQDMSTKKASGSQLFAMFGALGGALLGAVVWALVGIMGYVASIVGLLIAFLASKFYDKLGGKKGTIKVVTLIVCVLLAVLVGTLGTTLYQIHDFYQEAVKELKPWQEAIPEMEFVRSVLPDLWADKEAMGEISRNFGTGLFFALLGCFGTLRSSHNEGKSGYVILSR